MKLSLTLILAVAGIYVVGDAILAPAPEHPGFVDALLASRAALAASRLAIVFGAVYVVVSVVALIAKGRWLSRVGPIEVSEQAADADAENLRLEGELSQSRETIGRLRQEISVLKGEARRAKERVAP